MTIFSVRNILLGKGSSSRLIVVSWIDADTDALIWTIIEPGIGITTASMATFRPLLVEWKVPGFRRSANTMRGGTTGNEGPYINFQNLNTLPPATHSMCRGTKPQSTAHGGTYVQHGSEELILPHSKIVKTVEIAVVHTDDDGI
jgi:hypothetical protein